MFPYPAELMNCNRAPHPNVVSGGDVSPDVGVVGNDAVVTDDAVMGRMRVSHEQTITADPSYPTMGRRPGMKRDVFAQNGPGSDLKARFFAVPIP
jgi:hypothetical protein